MKQFSYTNITEFYIYSFPLLLITGYWIQLPVSYRILLCIPSIYNSMHLCMCVLSLCLTLCEQAALPLEFSQQEYWNELPFPSPGDLPDPGIKPKSLASPALAGRFFTTEPPGKPFLRSSYILSLGHFNNSCVSIRLRPQCPLFYTHKISNYKYSIRKSRKDYVSGLETAII